MRYAGRFVLCSALALALFVPAEARTRGPSTSAMAKALERAVESDSQAWVMNRFDAGSVTTVKVLGSLDDGSISIRGDYTFNGGQAGWVRAVYARGKIVCLQYWDRQDDCAGVRGSEDDSGSADRVTEDSSPGG